MTDNARDMNRLAVYISSDAVSRPTETDLDDTVHCDWVEIRANNGLARAHFTVDLGARGEHLQNLRVDSGMNRQVEVWTLDSEGNRDEALFWGEYDVASLHIGEDGESNTFTASVRDDHFGDVVRGQYCYDFHREFSYVIDYDLEFNPEIDGEIVNNMYPPNEGNNEDDFPIHIDAESTRSQNAMDLIHGATAEAWTLHDIVDMLMHLWNETEEFIDNRDRSYIDQYIEDPPEVRNLLYSRGGYLSEYLTDILAPLGFGWSLTFLDINGEIRPSFRFFKRGTGDKKTLKLQAFDSNIDPSLSNLLNFDMEVDIGRLTNRLRVQGALKEYEVTLPLYRSWETADDGNEDHQDNTDPIGRKWVANEGGDYKNVRTEIEDPPDIPNIGPPKKRVIDDCLTLRDDERRPVFVEYKPSGGAWTDLELLTKEFSILSGEIGLWLTMSAETGNAIPDVMLEANTEMRITGTIKSDKRVEFRTDPEEAESPNSRTIERLIDASDQFFLRERMDTETSSDFASVLTGDASERDDTDAIEEYANLLLKTEQGAIMEATAVLFGHDYEWRIGDVITKVEGREISLDRNVAGTTDPSYMQVVGIRYINTPGQQTTQLTVKQFDA